MHYFNHFYNEKAGLWLTSIVINLSRDELMLGYVANPLAKGKGKQKREKGKGKR
ncbi:MAG: hypothetical protein KME22_13235 [Hassallia sp. WJT32-NPBG1]|jgi:hypothetical protein|nr:hypothetical protein [Hassallia sp. WJT32-NPBG1]